MKQDWNNHPMLPVKVYEYFNHLVNHRVLRRIKDKHRLIEREEWSWAVLNAREYVINELCVPEEEVDTLLYDNKTIETFLFCLLRSAGFDFSGDAISDELFIGGKSDDD